MIAYARFDGETCAVITVNNNDSQRFVRINVRDAGEKEGGAFIDAFIASNDGYSMPRHVLDRVSGGYLSLTLPPKSAMILLRT